MEARDHKVEVWRQAMQEFHRQTMQGGGAFECIIIRPEHKLALLLAGEERYLKVIAEWFKQVRNARRPLRLACEHEFEPEGEVPGAFCLTRSSFRDDEAGGRVILTGICQECAQKDDAELLEIAYQGFKKLGLANRKLEYGVA
jgi:hypothetical protein